jgi:hypothetical protein
MLAADVSVRSANGPLPSSKSGTVFSGKRVSGISHPPPPPHRPGKSSIYCLHVAIHLHGVVLKHRSSFAFTRCALRIFCWGGGCLTLRLRIMFDFKNRVVKYNITLQLNLYTYKYNYVFHDSITVSYLLVFFLILLNIFPTSNGPVINRFQWLISAEGEIT